VFRVAFALAAMVTAAGAGIELLQILVGRDTSLLDALANAAGATLGLAAWILTVRRSPQQA
jgi:VanZ family protein